LENGYKAKLVIRQVIPKTIVFQLQSVSRNPPPNFLTTDGSMVKTMSRWTCFSPCLPYLFGHRGPRSGPVSWVLLPLSGWIAYSHTGGNM